MLAGACGSKTEAQAIPTAAHLQSSSCTKEHALAWNKQAYFYLEEYDTKKATQ